MVQKERGCIKPFSFYDKKVHAFYAPFIFYLIFQKITIYFLFLGSNELQFSAAPAQAEL